MPDPKQFTLSIALGNGGMHTPQDVAAALYAVSERLENAVTLNAGAGGSVRDSNGDVVGRWQVI